MDATQPAVDRRSNTSDMGSMAGWIGSHWKTLLFLAVVLTNLAWLVNDYGSLFLLRWTAQRGGDPGPGFVSNSLLDDSGVEHRYLVFVPHIPPPPDGYPVILFLNGFGENGNDGYTQIENTAGRPVWEMQELFPFVFIAPQCPADDSWTEGGEQLAIDVLDRVLVDYQVNTQRVSLWGVSSGASGALHLAAHYIDRFETLVLVSTTVGNLSSWANKLTNAKLPVWSFFNSGDQPNVVQFNQDMITTLRANEIDLRTTTYDRPGHDAWNNAFRTPALYRWILDPQSTDLIGNSSFTNWMDRGVETGGPSHSTGQSTDETKMGVADEAMSPVAEHSWTRPSPITQIGASSSPSPALASSEHLNQTEVDPLHRLDLLRRRSVDNVEREIVWRRTARGILEAGIVSPEYWSSGIQSTGLISTLTITPDYKPKIITNESNADFPASDDSTGFIEESVLIESQRRPDADSENADWRRQTDFNFALATRFKNQQRAALDPVVFRRRASTEQWVDHYNNEVDIHRQPFADDGNWARMMPDKAPRDRLDAAHAVAAVAALGGLGSPLINVDFDNFQPVAPPSISPAVANAAVQQTSQQSTNGNWWMETRSEVAKRYFCIDAAGRVIAIHGSGPAASYDPETSNAKNSSVPIEYPRESALPIAAGDTHIHVRYSAAGEPLGWTVVVAESSDRPIRWVCDAMIESVKRNGQVLKPSVFPSSPAVCLAGGEFASKTSSFSNQNPGLYGKDYIYPDSDTIDHFIGLGISLFRIPVRWERLVEDPGGPLNVTELARLDAVVQIIRQRGASMVLDLHNYGRYRMNVNGRLRDVRIDGRYGDQVPVSHADFGDFWKQIAGHYRDESAVIGYGLMNEPHDMAGSDWNVISQAAVDAVRTVDTQTHVIVAGGGWSSSMQFPLQNGPTAWIDDPSARTVYEAHCYLDRDRSGRYTESFELESSRDPELSTRVETVLNPFLDWCDHNNVSGWIGETGVPLQEPRWSEPLIQLTRRASQRRVGVCLWAAGQWWGDYPLSLQPPSLNHPPRNDPIRSAAIESLIQDVQRASKNGQSVAEPKTDLSTADDTRAEIQ